jgi:hypothetical protein
MSERQTRLKFAVCVANDGCDDLLVWKLYRVLPDDAAAREGYLRVVDDSGEDYLYPAGRFVAVELSETAEQKLLAIGPSNVA